MLLEVLGDPLAKLQNRIALGELQGLHCGFAVPGDLLGGALAQSGDFYVGLGEDLRGLAPGLCEDAVGFDLARLDAVVAEAADQVFDA